MTPTGGALTIPATSRLKAAALLGVQAVLFGLLLLFISRTWADPDLWGHVKFGGDIATEGLHSNDPYSFGRVHPWINHEWLAELVMFQAWAVAGGDPQQVTGDGGQQGGRDRVHEVDRRLRQGVGYQPSA